MTACDGFRARAPIFLPRQVTFGSYVVAPFLVHFFCVSRQGYAG
jgi:hypothetical protein